MEAGALKLVAAHCDIEERIKLVPPTARVRGVLFRPIHTQLEKRGLLEPFDAYFRDKRAAMPFYPLTDYLLRLAVAGALVTTPERLHEGMFEISKGNAREIADSLLGRALLRLLARDPVRLTEQGLAARRQTMAYGHWSIVRHGERSIEMVYENEYTWIESAIAGSAVGTFEACGLTPQIETRLVDRFNGSTRIEW
ncbi:MAG TPA: TIGR02265 family protein [Polyangiaceae bacterium]|nr:TIGR02265 family protein [Polyangiaceae bacterium]